MMPTASDEQREMMRKWFGDPVDDSGPYIFLRRHGYTDHAGMWRKPTPAHTISDAEWQCIVFLCDEWDYGFDEVTNDPA
jgi:hypothetical protein